MEGLQCVWLILVTGIGLLMILSSTQASSATTTNSTVRTGPDFSNFSNPIVDNTYRLAAVTDHIYLDNSEPVPCSGLITRWHYCFVVIGFHNISSGLQPCVWRRSKLNDSSGYKMIGCNKFTIIPGNIDGLQCQCFVPSSPSDFIRVEKGDYIGFYVPDAGLFLPFSLPDYDMDNYQLRRNATGSTPFIKDSELRNATIQPGRALLSAEIGSYD